MPLGIAIAIILASSPMAKAQRELRAPNGGATAAISQIGATCPESRVAIRVHGEGATQDFASPDCRHGYVVAHAQWTSDSRYFVFDLESSGGHQPMNRPLWRYSASTRRVEAVPLPPNILPTGFRIRPHSRLSVQVWDIDRQASGVRAVNLAAGG